MYKTLKSLHFFFIKADVHVLIMCNKGSCVGEVNLTHVRFGCESGTTRRRGAEEDYSRCLVPPFYPYS